MRSTLKYAIPSLVAALTLAACGSTSSSTTQSTAAASSAVAPNGGAAAGSIKTVSDSTLGANVLADAQGFTLYTLSGEQGGKFLCTSSACVAKWHPVSASAVSSSVGGLTTVKRPDGSAQLAYKGMPLYSFVGDKSPGEASGQGVKDNGGTWNAATVGASSAGSAGSTPAAPASSGSSGSEGSSGESSGGGGSGGGYGY
jgi:predicted lipoprotein with Yx(FWY)xxD motif